MSAEEWRPIPGFPAYEVSDQGRVRSHLKWKGKPTPRILALVENPQNHYRHVSIIDASGSTKTQTIHCLVMLAFVGPRPAGMVVRHLDGDKSHNALSNLAYGTRAENEADKVRHGTAQWLGLPTEWCARGLHQFTPENTVRTDGHRRCRACRDARLRRVREAA